MLFFYPYPLRLEHEHQKHVCQKMTRSHTLALGILRADERFCRSCSHDQALSSTQSGPIRDSLATCAIMGCFEVCTKDSPSCGLCQDEAVERVFRKRRTCSNLQSSKGKGIWRSISAVRGSSATLHNRFLHSLRHSVALLSRLSKR